MVDRLNKPNEGVEDWHIPVNENFEDVEEASYVERTVADFEGGTLPQDAVGDTANASVQSSVALEGDYSLEISRTSTGFSNVALESGRDVLPQFGDSFSYNMYLTDTNDQSSVAFFVENPSIDPFSGTGVIFAVSAENNRFLFAERIDGNNIRFDNIKANVSNHLNEVLTITIEVTVDGFLDATLTDSNGVEIDNHSGDLNSRIPSTGGVIYRVENDITAPTGYFDGPFIERRETQARRNTKKGTTQLGNEVVPSGGIHTGPTTSSTNAERAIYQDAPVDTNVTQGTQSKLTLLQSGLNPAMFMERTLDGQGGAYGHQLQAPLGRFARLNANLSWEYDTLADLPNWDTGSVEGHSYDLVNFPRTAQIQTSGNSTTDYDGFNSTAVVSHQSVDAYSITFHNVTVTNGNPLLLGVSGGNVNLFNINDGLVFAGGVNAGRLRVFENGTEIATSVELSDMEASGDKFTFKYDGSTFEAYKNGVFKDSLSATVTGTPLVPILGIRDDSTQETMEVEQVTVEPLPEVLQ